MGSARLSVAIILVTVLFKVSFGQFSLGSAQDCKSSNSHGLPQDQGSQRLFNLISNTQATNCNSKPLTGLQQFLNCQKHNNQQGVNSMPGTNVQQPSNLQNLVQSQSDSRQNDFYALPLNLQRKILQQIQEIQGGITSNNNMQMPEQLSSFQPSLGPLPVVNGQISGLPPHVSQGLLLSNLGLTSIPSSVPNTCSCNNQGAGQVVVPQNTVATVSNNVATSSTSAPEGYFTTKFIPISAIPLQSSAQPQTSYQLPVSQENGSANQQQNNIVQSTTTDKQNIPMQFAFHPVQQPLQIQNQQSAKCQHTPPPDMDPQALLTSLLLSQLGMSNGAAYNQYQTGPPSYQPTPVPSLPTPNQGSKSSSVKALLPILLNMLKDKGDCGCHNNNNCGCFKDNQSNKELPQVIQGYSKQFNHGQQRKINFEPTSENTSKNTIGSKETNSDKENTEKIKPNNKNSSAEDDDEDEHDSYEEDDPEDESSS